MAGEPKTAVVVVHGMGEQVPMQTLSILVEAVWTTDTDLTGGNSSDGNPSWAKPDQRIKNFELRRITTGENTAGKRTDFYEFYWAHLMKGNTWEHVKGWIQGLLLRNPFTRVPRRMLPAWIVLWLITIVTGVALLWGLMPKDLKPEVWALFFGDRPPPGARSGFVTTLFGLAAGALVSNVLVKRFGDVARYVTATPPNVDRRQAIREKGVELLETLTNSKTSDNSADAYDRIVIVAHSLGTIVAYDVLTHFFARQNRSLRSKVKQPERHKMEEMLRKAAGLPLTAEQAGKVQPVPEAVALDLDMYQDQQAACFKEAQGQGGNWKISDFVTLGAPLTHAEFLMAESREAIHDKQVRRVLPTCPPVLEDDGDTGLRHFSYGGGAVPDNARTPHHAALFAYTRWTNLYSDHRLIVFGDIISGPVSEVFALKENGHEIKGVRDIAVLPATRPDGHKAGSMKRPFFSHNHYWNIARPAETIDVKVPHHIKELRKALRLWE